MSLYIIVPPARLTVYRQLLRMWLSGLMVALTQRKAAPASRTLMLCDEIGNVGKMDAFLMGATLMASWGLTFWSFWQNPDQLKIYGGLRRIRWWTTQACCRCSERETGAWPPTSRHWWAAWTPTRF